MGLYLQAVLRFAICVSGLVCVSHAYAQTPQASLFEHRAAYLKAKQHLRLGQTKDFKRAQRDMGDYALAPYLTYYDLNRRLATVSANEMSTFLNAEPRLAVTEILHKRWLRELGKQRRWKTFLEHPLTTSDAELNCYRLRAMYGTGNKQQALNEATALWTQPRSQPKACDPLFEVWRSTSRFTEEVVWTRFSAAIFANEVTLGRYLLRYLTGDNRIAGDALYEVHVTPSRLARTSQYARDTPKFRQLLSHGLTRLARRDSKKASKAWRAYAKTHQFDVPTRARIEGALAVASAEQEQIFPKDEQRETYTHADTLESLANAAVEGQAWSQAQYWISRLPADIAGKSQWQYWRARAEQLTGSISADPMAVEALAQQRHYYGFLAASRLGLPGQLNATPRAATTFDLSRIRQHPGIHRAIELFAVGEDINGHREWYRALNSMGPPEKTTAAELAADLGLISLGIRTANIAEASDHLHLRFPTAYAAQFSRASMTTNLPTALLFSIARQESAMQADARSSADARGLMQLLPSTARLVARRAHLPAPKTADLYDPATNIRLGSYHLAWLLARYNGQAPLAIAAYNAGEHRVDRWIKDAAGMPMDLWIERIPFHETRNYVKNVLAFRRVYGELLGSPTPILNTREQVVGQP